jgi:protein-S-isoprenylcysteine O-methyltransferase Ste14
MYVGLLILLLGEALLYDSLAVVIYASIAGVIFHIFILIHEEPVLTRKFGNEYVNYAKQVNRWIPRCPLGGQKKRLLRAALEIRSRSNREGA